MHACAPACRGGEAAINQGHGINSTPNLIWGCGRVAMRAVGGWAPSARKLTSPHRAAHACMHDSCMLHGDTHALHRLHAANSNISLRAFRGMAKGDTQLLGVWQGGHARWGGVGTQRKKNICAKQIICYIYIQRYENFWQGACAGHRSVTISREFFARCMWYDVAMRAWGGAGHRSAKIS
jgi:hypothetical protein